MKILTSGSTAILGALLFAVPGRGQAPAGPITPQPGVTVQIAPTAPTIKLRSILVNTPVTVRDASGEMVHTLEAKDFRVTDNGVEQKITHFDLGGDPGFQRLGGQITGFHRQRGRGRAHGVEASRGNLRSKAV